jgi:hypothetical protein
MIKRITLSFLLMLFVLGTVWTQTTIQRSLYVSAKGDDNNNGRSEETPFKTLKKASEAANSGVIKTITIIGTIDGDSEIRQEGNDEILITGKSNVSGAERAVLDIDKVSGKVRFTYIRLAGLSAGWGRATVTLGTGVIVSNPKGTGVSGITLIMTDDATITGCLGGGVRNTGDVIFTVTMSGNASIINNGGIGIELQKGRLGESKVTMSGNAKVSNNKGMGVYCETLIMSENAEISDNVNTETNREKINGGGVNVFTLTMSGNTRIINNSIKGNGGGVYIDQERGSSTISGNAIISGNTAKHGGGIYLSSGILTMEGGEISGNKAEYGAGVYVAKERTLTHKSGTITRNEAEYVGGGVYVQSGGTYTAGSGRVISNSSGDLGDDNVFRQ